MAESPEQGVVPFQVEAWLDRLREQIRLDVEIASDLDAIKAGTFVPAPDPERGGF